ncbi:MAG: hypothetical protein QNJ12_06215 [Ilumatobacter sp.]|uniref:hypothetical protein n=1 Tax=Ilumatobacter sp. TaxID=1967498 RepID=UPI00261E7FBD|nr:hypothetical protein [Ilumatobacter sp.]MDJ0768367.1 hypothetical protein [Ilumatobacter sp.]
MSRRTIAGAALAVALVAAGCNGDDESTPTTLAPQTNPPITDSSSTVEPTVDTDAPASTSTSATPPTTAPPPTTTEPEVVTVTSTSDVPPTTQPGEPDWTAIIQGFYDTLDDIQAAPDSTRIDELCAPGSPCRNTLGAQIEALERDGWRVVDVSRTLVSDGALAGTPDDVPLSESQLAIVRAQLSSAGGDPGRIIDANGETLFDIDPSPLPDIPTNYIVQRHSDGTWRLFEIL